ncbi:MAG: NADH-quinone oxidoreductase subunit N [Cyanobacteriota bacterium]
MTDLINFLPMMTIVFFAILVLLVDVFIDRKDITAYLSLSGIFLSVLTTIGLWTQYPLIKASYFNDSFVVNNYSLFFYMIFLISGGVCIFTSPSYLKQEKINHGEYYSLILFAISGMMLMASSNDILTQFLALEIMSISIYVLVGFKRLDIKSNEATLKYYFLGAFSAGFILYGIAMLYGATGTTILSEMRTAISSHNFGYRGITLIGTFFLLTGILFKVAAVPFHSWAPDVYEGAPNPITGFMISAVKAASFAMFIKIFLVGLIDLKDMWSPVIQLIAVFTMFLGNILAFTQENIKRMLAYSSISHTGYLLLGIATLSTSSQSSSAMLYYLASYCIGSVGLFACISYLNQKNENYLNIEDYSGLGFKQPFIAFSIFIFMVSLIGIPPTAGFFGKYYLFSAAINQGMFLTVILALINSMMSVYYYLKVIMFMYIKESHVETFSDSGRLSTNIVLALTTLATVWLGFGTSTVFSIIPGAYTVIEWTKMSIQSIL